MVHPADMTNPVGVAATEFTDGSRHFPTPHPPETGRGGYAQSGVPSHACRVGFFNYAQRWVVSGRLVAVMADCDHQLG